MPTFDFTAAKDALITYLNGSSATVLDALNPRPTAIDCESPHIEELISSAQGGVIGVDDRGATLVKSRTSSNNMAQTSEYRFDLYVSSTGDSRADARDNVREIVSAIIEDLVGDGAYIGTDRSTVFSCVWDSWEWAPPANDAMVADAVMQITMTLYRRP